MAGETILVVEDNDAVAAGLTHGLSREGFRVQRAGDLNLARAYLEQQSPDLFLLDVRLPDGSGFEFCRELRVDGYRQPIVILTARDEMIDKVIGLELGADDYVTKPFELRELVARIRAQLRRAFGSLADGPRMHFNVGDLAVDLARQKVSRQGVEIRLTATEFKLLTTLLQNQGRPVARERLFEIVWGAAPMGSDHRIIDVHIRNLRQKLEYNPAEPEIVLTVRGVGYRLAG